MNKKLLGKLIHLKVEEYKLLKKYLPSPIKKEIDKFENTTKNFVKEIAVEYLKQSNSENDDTKKDRKVKKVIIDN